MAVSQGWTGCIPGMDITSQTTGSDSQSPQSKSKPESCAMPHSDNDMGAVAELVSVGNYLQGH